MYYGYGQMWLLTFVPIGFVIVMTAMVCLSLVYAVGASNGRMAAEKYLRWVMWGLGLAVVVDLVWAGVSGQLATFLESYGAAPLIEMGALAALGVGSLWFMAVAYVNSKAD